MKGFRKGGIHPSPMKITAGAALKTVSLPQKLYIPLSQHIGKPAVALVKPGDEVEALQMIARADGFVSAPVHSPVAGKVTAIGNFPDAQGNPAAMIEITPSAEAGFPAPDKPENHDYETGLWFAPDEIRRAVAEAGIVGMGGAAFPTAVKLNPPKDAAIDTVILNGAECEPFLTCDDTLMRLYPEKILMGGELIRVALGAQRLVVGIESNKPEAAAAMREASRRLGKGEIEVLRTRYPQGGEKQLIEAIATREVPAGKLPADVDVVVDNVATAYAVYNAVFRHRPLTERIVTLTLPGSPGSGNYLVPAGMRYSDLLEAAGITLPEEECKVIAGGPMMGRAVSNTDAPIVKAFSGLTVLHGRHLHRNPEQPCIRCGKCTCVCPMGLEPYFLYKLAKSSRWEDMEANAALSCVECGSCQWSCPASKPLLDRIRLGKRQIRNLKR